MTPFGLVGNKIIIILLGKCNINYFLLPVKTQISFLKICNFFAKDKRLRETTAMMYPKEVYLLKGPLCNGI